MLMSRGYQASRFCIRKAESPGQQRGLFRFGAFADITEESFHLHYDINVLGSILTIVGNQAFRPRREKFFRFACTVSSVCFVVKAIRIACLSLQLSGQLRSGHRRCQTQTTPMPKLQPSVLRRNFPLFTLKHLQSNLQTCLQIALRGWLRTLRVARSRVQSEAANRRRFLQEVANRQLSFSQMAAVAG